MYQHKFSTIKNEAVKILRVQYCLQNVSQAHSARTRSFACNILVNSKSLRGNVCHNLKDSRYTIQWITSNLKHIIGYLTVINTRNTLFLYTWENGRYNFIPNSALSLNSDYDIIIPAMQVIYLSLMRVDHKETHIIEYTGSTIFISGDLGTTS